MRIGYAIISSQEPTFDAQKDALTRAGCEKIHADLLTGAREDRRALDAALADAGEGDTLVVATLDVLARSQARLLEIVTALHEKRAGLTSLDEHVETTTGGDGKVVVQNFGALAAFSGRGSRGKAAARPDAARARVARRVALGAVAAAFVLLLYVACFALLPRYDKYTGRVVSAAVTSAQPNATKQTLTVVVTSGDLNGRQYTLENSYAPGIKNAAYQRGDSVLLGYSASANRVYIDTLDRRGPMFFLLLIFLALIVVVAKRQGIMSVLGMLFSIVVIMTFVVPHILAGDDPLLYAALSALVIIPASYYLAHGLHRKTTVAILATFATLALTFALAAVFVHLMKLPVAIAVEDEPLYLTNAGTLIDLQSFYLAALVIGALAVLNDITISQASIVASLFASNPSLRLNALFAHAMDVGKDHVASLINTLLLVYIGASFTSFLAITRSVAYGSFGLSDPAFAADVVRTLVVSIGIVAAVPISTAIAAYLTMRKKR